jgi:trans-aconitate 2-methyltransferase
MPTWDAGLYLTFADERTRPAADLAARVTVAAPARVVDLGCGPGNSTAVLRARWPAAEVVGVDSSPDMIAAATRADPAGRWVQADIATWTDDRPFDVVFSNAALHWVREDHAELFPRLFGLVAPGGALAVQMPDVNQTAMHKQLAAVAGRPAWRDRLTAAKASLRVERPGFYYDVLRPGASRLDLWATEYLHVMAGPADILTWVRATALRPYLEALADDAERSAFEAELLAAVTAAFPPQADGKVLFPYRRLFVVAYRAGVG